LNGGFASLLGAIPDKVIGVEADGSDGASQTERSRKVMSEGEVLTRAKRYVKRLEKSIAGLEVDNEALRCDVKRSKQLLLEQGGQLMP